MTTIAYHHIDKQIAVDSRISIENEILTDKGGKTIENSIGLWIFAGTTCDFNDFAALKHNDKVDPPPTCRA